MLKTLNNMDKRKSLSENEIEKLNEFKVGNKGIILEYYVNSNDINTIKLLLTHYPEYVDIYNTDYFGETPLFNATETKNYEISSLLLKNGADVNAANFEDKTTPLMNCSFNNDNKTTNLLLQYNANPDIVNKYGDTALHIACRNGYIEIVKLLLEHNANPYIENKFMGSNTPFKLASREGHHNIVSLLKEKMNENNCLDN